MKGRIAIVIAMTALGAAPAGAQARELALGGEVFGTQTDPLTAAARCAELDAAGSGATALFTTQGQLTRDDGSFNFNGVDADVDSERACGLEPGLRVDAKLSADDTGYPDDPEAYAQLLRALSAHLAGRVQRFAIDNEAAVEAHFPDTPERYYEMLRLASTAIHAGNPDALVVDASMSYGSLGVVEVNDLWQQGRRAEALALLQEVQANELGGGPPVKDESDVEAYLAGDKAQRMLRFFELAVANQDAYDVFQFHYYGPSQSLPGMLATVRRLGITRPIEIWELNHRYLDGRPYDDAEHADETARLLLTAAGEGSAWTVFTNLFDRLDHQNFGLLDSSGARRLAFGRFAVISSELSGATAASPLKLPPEAGGYSFERPAGEVLALWSGERAKVGRRLPIDASTVAVASTADGIVRHRRLAGLRAKPTPALVTPDLVQIARAGDGRRRHRLRLRLDCPQDSRFGHCAGMLRVKGAAAEPVPYRLRRGDHDRAVIELQRSRRARKVLAVASRCPDRRRRCASWLKL